VAYAFFVQTSNVRRWIIIASAIPIAIATNALRVIITGILAQWWGAAAAEGFFHEFAGMAVFILAMALLVAMGAIVKRGNRGKSAGETTTLPSERFTASTDDRIKASPHFLTAYVLLIATALFINMHTDISIPTNRPFSDFPTQVRSWRMSSKAEFSANVLNVLKPTDYISRQYKSADGKVVDLYIGFHSGGKGSGGIHSPKHCLPGSGWYEVSSKRGVLDTPGGNVNLVYSVYQKGERKELFLYWFQMMGQSISDEYLLKLSEIKNSIMHRRRDKTFIRISVPFEDKETEAVAIAEQFARDFEPTFREFLPR
jgi:EpsI family protein